MNEPIPIAKKRRSIALWIFVLSALPFSVAALLLYANDGWLQLLEAAYIGISLLSISAWCRFDAEIQNYRISLGLRVGILLMAVIGVPIYLANARGMRGALKVGFGLPPLLASTALYYGGWYVARWIAGNAGYFG